MQIMSNLKVQSSKLNSRHHHFHWIHLIAVSILGIYFVLSKINLAYSLANRNTMLAFLQVYLFGIFFACLFLYIFSHERFFSIAREIKKTEEKKEKKYLKKYFHYGKVLTTFIIGSVGGPVFSSLTARLLLNHFNPKYLIVILANILPTLFTVGLGKTLVKILNF